jgi:hypothetical protein
MYRVERTTDEGQTWTRVGAAFANPDTDEAALAAWDLYCDLSESERVRLVKDGRVISTSHVDDATKEA